MVTYKLLMPLLFVVGFLIRLVLLNNSVVTKILENRIEISTPITAWKRAVEGVILSEKNINPYDGDVYHENPLMLAMYKQIFSLGQVAVIFTICDIFTACMLAASASIYVRDLAKKEGKTDSFPSTAIALLLKPGQVELIPFYVASIYLFSPYSIASCCGKSTITFLNCCLSLFILLTFSGHWFLASVILGVISYQSLYHISLIVCLIMYIDKKYSSGKNLIPTFTRVIVAVLMFVATLCSLLLLSHKKTGSWGFLSSTYGFTLSVPDLTPNIGLFWYFFTEMFEHFRVFFLWTFQLNAFIYTVPLAIRLRGEPMLLLFVHLILIALFKSYPSIGDVVLYLSLLPVWQHLFLFMRQSFLVGCVLVSCTLLAPTLWHLWIYSGSANANFYFAITLAFNTGQIFLLTDVLSAFIKREYYLQHGVKTDEDGKLLLLRLQ